MAGYVSGSSIQILAIGVVAIAVMSVGAATISESVNIEGGTPLSNDDPGGGDGPGEQVNNSTGLPSGDGGDDPGIATNISRCIDFLDSLPGTVAYFGIAGLVFYGMKRRFSIGTTMMAVFGASPVLFTLYFLNTDCVATGEQGGSSILNQSGGGAPLPEVSPVVLIGIVGVVLVAAAAVVVRATGDQYEEPEEEDVAGEEPDVADLAEAAGAAADRLEKHNADVDNAVYRAWWEMTQLLDVPNPDSATPGEFADAAVDVGMASDHVDELTTLFEEVRYGKRDAGSREEHAVEVFRTIESEYGADANASFEGGAGGQSGAGDTR